MFNSIKTIFSKEADKEFDLFARLKQQIVGIGHPDFPFFDKIYSPGTQMPCTDFTQWIIECINNQDPSSVVRLLCEFCDEKVAKSTVKTLWNWDFREKIDADESVITEIKAIWLVANIRGEKRESLLGIIFFNALMGCSFRIKPAFWDLIIRELNQFKRRTERLYPLGLSREMLDFPQYSESNPFIDWLPQIPVSARMHFWETLSYFFSRRKVVVNLQDCTNYTLREYGINTIETTQILVDSGAFEIPFSFSQLGKEINKDEICDILNQAGIESKKSWKKEKLLAMENPGITLFIQKYAENSGLYLLHQEYSVFAKELFDCREKFRPLFDALCVL